MVFDVIFLLFVLGTLGMSSSESPLSRPGHATVAEAPAAPDEITDMAIEELACLRDPDPTPILRAMMDHGLIHADSREDFESYSCFAVPGGMSLASINVNAVCGGVMSASVNAENPDLYPPNERILDDERYQMIAFGTNDDLDTLLDWYNAMYGPRLEGTAGATDGLYAPAISLNELYCDDILADDVAFAAEEAAAMDYPSKDGGETDVPGHVAPLPAPPAPPVE